MLNEQPVRDVVAFDGQIEPYLDLELGRLDAVLLDSIIALYYASTNPKLKYVGEPSHPGVYAIAGATRRDGSGRQRWTKACCELVATADWQRSCGAGICGTRIRLALVQRCR